MQIMQYVVPSHGSRTLSEYEDGRYKVFFPTWRIIPADVSG